MRVAQLQGEVEGSAFQSTPDAMLGDSRIPARCQRAADGNHDSPRGTPRRRQTGRRMPASRPSCRRAHRHAMPHAPKLQ
ncbi:hypothetical protein XFF6992_50069 [Xanthomonas citri pv. fuscans]|nr:hypothetical protein XFF6992_50069 [Xanthomonas citri pv. fuscans]SOO33043.1 hypothetical protein XFF6994_260002 [Xanthomonas citri pv. fuscans]